MLPPWQIGPNVSVYKTVHGPYDWNRFPLVPPGCKAVMYESSKAHTLWGSLGTNTWYVGPSLNHYRCNHYFVQETWAYWISGSAKLFLQHCQVPFLLWNEHMQEVIDELATTLHEMPLVKQTCVLTLVTKKLSWGHIHNPKCSVTHPGHEFDLREGDRQRVP
jgi:hypothetical protein